MYMQNKKLLISILSVFMICLIASTATTTIADNDWGALKAGDEMTWKYWEDPAWKPDDYTTYKVKILSFDGDDIIYEETENGDSYVSSTEWSGSISVFVEPIDTLSIGNQKKTYEWKGTTYKAFYQDHTYYDDRYQQIWWDQGTGILFEWRITYPEGDAYTHIMLISCTADLTVSSGGCLGTVLIALVSITTVISYSIVKFRKKIKP